MASVSDENDDNWYSEMDSSIGVQPHVLCCRVSEATPATHLNNGRLLAQ